MRRLGIDPFRCLMLVAIAVLFLIAVEQKMLRGGRRASAPDCRDLTAAVVSAP
jgi:hypothetical protein